MLIGVAEAGDRLNVSPRRIRALIATNALPAQRISGRWVLDEAALDKVAVRPAVRPMSPRMAAGLLAVLSGDAPLQVSPAERTRLAHAVDRLRAHHEPADLLRAWLRHRGSVLHLSAARADVPDLAADPRLVPSGISDSRTRMAPDGEYEAWVAAEDLEAVRDDYLLSEVGSPNVILHVTDGPPPSPVPLGWVLADLADPRGPRENGEVRRLLNEYRHAPATPSLPAVAPSRPRTQADEPQSASLRGR